MAPDHLPRAQDHSGVYLVPVKPTLPTAWAGLHRAGLIASVYSWYNLNVYPSEFYGPTAAEASQAQAFVFTIRDQKLGAKISQLGPTGLAKYFMRLPTREIIFGGETMRF